MKIKFLALILGVVLLSCEKENMSSESTESITEKDHQLRAPITGLSFSIESGTRKQLEHDIEMMELMGASQADINAYRMSEGTCAGRSFCIVLEGETIIAGGISEADDAYLCDNGMYSFVLTKLASNYEFKVTPDYILPADKAVVFEGGIFEMDADFNFPDWVCDMYEVESIVLPAGTYPVTELGDGTVLFNF